MGKLPLPLAASAGDLRTLRRHDARIQNSRNDASTRRLRARGTDIEAQSTAGKSCLCARHASTVLSSLSHLVLEFQLLLVISWVLVKVTVTVK